MFAIVYTIAIGSAILVSCSMHKWQMVAGVNVSCCAAHRFRTAAVKGLSTAHGPVISVQSEQRAIRMAASTT